MIGYIKLPLSDIRSEIQYKYVVESSGKSEKARYEYIAESSMDGGNVNRCLLVPAAFRANEGKRYTSCGCGDIFCKLSAHFFFFFWKNLTVLCVCVC